MYEAPITIIEQAVEQFVKEKNAEIESYIMKVVASYEINVDKEALIKALNNDRNEYNKGYNEGINDLVERLKKGEYIVKDDKYGKYHLLIEIGEFNEILKELSGEQHAKSNAGLKGGVDK